ncbi:hypothetical protein MMC26_000683 [Xylographa opegraphella]|nr:hypothetical protein [Xylographa opegraphella]
MSCNISTVPRRTPPPAFSRDTSFEAGQTSHLLSGHLDTLVVTSLDLLVDAQFCGAESAPHRRMQHDGQALRYFSPSTCWPWTTFCLKMVATSSACAMCAVTSGLEADNALFTAKDKRAWWRAESSRRGSPAKKKGGQLWLRIRSNQWKKEDGNVTLEGDPGGAQDVAICGQDHAPRLGHGLIS